MVHGTTQFALTAGQPRVNNWSDHLTRARRRPSGSRQPCHAAWPNDQRRNVMRNAIRALLRGAAVAALAVGGGALAQAPITLHGAVQFNDGHAFNRALEKFQELTAKYYGKPINFVLHKNSELGLEKDYFAYMNQG